MLFEILKMELIKAKEIVKTLLGKHLSDIVKSEDDITEAIRLVCLAACHNDDEAIEIQKCIPNEMEFIGLYPFEMKAYNIIPDSHKK